MSDEKIQFNQSEREAIADRIAAKLWTTCSRSPIGLPLTVSLAALPLDAVPLEERGIRVLSPLEVAEIVGKTPRHLARLERLGEIPRRRRISTRRTGYLVHELEGFPAESVLVQDPRTLGREQVAGKLGVNEKTVARMVRKGKMPPPVHGRWLEREIDTWLLNRPLV